MSENYFQGPALKARREKLGISAKRLAEWLSVDPDEIRNAERPTSLNRVRVLTDTAPLPERIHAALGRCERMGVEYSDFLTDKEVRARLGLGKK